MPKKAEKKSRPRNLEMERHIISLQQRVAELEGDMRRICEAFREQFGDGPLLRRLEEIVYRIQES